MRLTLILLFLSITFYASGQNCFLTGQIKNEQNKPFHGVTVMLGSERLVMVSNQEGNFAFNHLPTEEHQVFITYTGYQPQKRTIFLNTEKTPFRIRLLPTPMELKKGFMKEATRNVNSSVKVPFPVKHHA